MLTEIFAAVTHSPLMKRIIISPMLLVAPLFAAVVLLSWSRPDVPGQQESHRIWSIDQTSAAGPQTVLLRPFVTPGKTYGVALDGGRQPVFVSEVPSLYFGTRVDCPLQLLLIGDWQSAGTRALFRQFEALYRADSAGTLPPLALSLLPKSAAVRESPIVDLMIAAHFVSSYATTFPTIHSAISSGATPMEPLAIRAHLEKLEPEIGLRIDSVMSGRQGTLEKVFGIARSQWQLNASVLGCTETTQLVATQQILTGAPDAAQLAAFLSKAKANQDAYFSSPIGKVPVVPPTGCDCKETGHPH